jgi:hypothetical protein
LSNFFQLCHLQPALFFLFTLFVMDQTPTFIYIAARTLLDAMMSSLGSIWEFVTYVQHALALAWNHKGENCSIGKRAFLLDFADRLGPSPSFDGWSIFLGSVLRHYHKRRAYPVDFAIPEKGMDPAIADALNDWPNHSDLFQGLSPFKPRRSSFGDTAPSPALPPVTELRSRRDPCNKRRVRCRRDWVASLPPIERVTPSDKSEKPERTDQSEKNDKKKCNVA